MVHNVYTSGLGLVALLLLSVYGAAAYSISFTQSPIRFRGNYTEVTTYLPIGGGGGGQFDYEESREFIFYVNIDKTRRVAELKPYLFSTSFYLYIFYAGAMVSLVLFSPRRARRNEMG
jgi:hypothetical protein